MSYKKLNQININNDSLLSNIKFTNPNPNNNKPIYCNNVGKHYIFYTTEYDGTNICNNKLNNCKHANKGNKSCCC